MTDKPEQSSAEPSAPVERREPKCEDCWDTGKHYSDTPPFDELVSCTTHGCKAAEIKEPTETLYQKGRRLAREGHGMSSLWGECKSDDELPEVERGWVDEMNVRAALERKP